MCWCYWKINNSKEKMLKIYNEGKESAKEWIKSTKERYILTHYKPYRIFDTRNQNDLTMKEVCRKLNRLEYYKGICFD